MLSGSAAGLTAGTATLTITDDDTASTGLALSVSPASVAENAGATTVTVTATLNAGARTTATEVTVSRTGGSAGRGLRRGQLHADDTETSGTANFTPTDDSLARATRRCG